LAGDVPDFKLVLLKIATLFQLGALLAITGRPIAKPAIKSIVNDPLSHAAYNYERCRMPGGAATPWAFFFYKSYRNAESVWLANSKGIFLFDLHTRIESFTRLMNRLLLYFFIVQKHIMENKEPEQRKRNSVKSITFNPQDESGMSPVERVSRMFLYRASQDQITTLRFMMDNGSFKVLMDDSEAPPPPPEFYQPIVQQILKYADIRKRFLSHKINTTRFHFNGADDANAIWIISSPDLRKELTLTREE